MAQETLIIMNYIGMYGLKWCAAIQTPGDQFSTFLFQKCSILVNFYTILLFISGLTKRKKIDFETFWCEMEIFG